MQDQWIDNEPTPECFDATTGRMEALYGFIDGTADQTTCDSVRSHIIDCVRCQYIYACVLKG